MKLMNIALDPTPAIGERGSSIGDVSERLVYLSDLVGEIHHICRAPGSAGPSIRKEHNLTTYAVPSRFKFLYPFLAFLKGAGIIKSNGMDVIYAQDPFLCGLGGYLLSRFYDVPLIMGMHADFLDNPHWVDEKPSNSLLNALGKSLVGRADMWRAVSHRIKERLVEMGVPEDRILVVPTGGGIDVEAFAKADGSKIRREFKSKGYDNIVLFVGRLAKQKNLPLLLEVAKVIDQKHPRTLFLLIGSGKQKENLECMIHEMGLRNLLLLGKIPYSSLPDYYVACDIVVLTSNYEGLPKTVEEAFAAGKPVVSTRVSGSTELVIDGKTGYLVDIGDSKAFAERLSQLLSRKEIGRRMGREGKKLIEKNYSRKKNFSKMYLNLYLMGKESKK
jgi:glycosyltransferase involved in cell wall biosynthesis